MMRPNTANRKSGHRYRSAHLVIRNSALSVFLLRMFTRIDWFGPTLKSRNGNGVQARAGYDAGELW
jgi:hypothetical protein